MTILNTACGLGLEECLSEAAKLFNNFIQIGTRPHPDLRETVYYYGMVAVGNEQSWEAMWRLFVDEADASEKAKLMYGLSAVQQPWILSR